MPMRSNPTLKVTIEGSWRGAILDTVRPIVDLILVEHESISGLKNLGNEYPLRLISGETVMVWCALTPNHLVKFSLKQNKASLFELTTEGAFYAEVLLSDGKLYQFKYENES
jgi:hypothetical protein